MCGFAGLVEHERGIERGLLERMGALLAHRGPDDSGVWTQANVGLAHRRLAVVDLSSAGHQPMMSASGRWVMAYNGEVYNASSLRQDLPGVDWRGSSDTEVVLEAVERWGVEAAVSRFVGMFAFAAFDTMTRELWLARDRLGIKPLYFGWVPARGSGRFVFASELTALRPVTRDLHVDRSAASTFLRHGYIPGPNSIFEEIHKLRPGHTICIDTTTTDGSPLPDSRPYWRLEDHVVDASADSGAPPSLDSAEAELLGLMRQAVSDRLVADVPVGAFLSGGYDSTLVCALMQEALHHRSGRALKTFTIGFDDPRFDESVHAGAIARHLGTDHTELIVGEEDLLAAIGRLDALCDEPFADPSILPTFLVSQLARNDVTVTLSGDGGDELFWGYDRYGTTARIWSRLEKLPLDARRAAAAAVDNRVVRSVVRSLPAPSWGGRQGTLSQKLAAASTLARARDDAELFELLSSQFARPAEIVSGASELSTPYNDPQHWTRALGLMPRSALQDTLAYLPDDILTKVDRASMAVGLEARVPLLDHRLVEYVLGLPDHDKRDGDRTKILLRRVLQRFVPPRLTERPKMGFGVPLGPWLSGPLREWTCDLLDAKTIRAQGLLEPGPVERLLDEHLSGRADNSAKLWNLLMLQQFLQPSDP